MKGARKTKVPTKGHNKRSPDPDLKMALDAIENLTARQVAERSDNVVGRSTIYNWRSGRVARPLNYTVTAVMAAAGFRKEWRKVK